MKFFSLYGHKGNSFGHGICSFCLHYTLATGIILLQLYCISNTILFFRKEGLLESLIEHRNDGYSTHEYLVKSNLLMVMHLLNQHCVETGEKDLALHVTYDRLKPALDWVRLSYAMDTPVQYVADLCGFSTSYFMKLFKDLMGTGFTAYLNNYRLELAAYQLAVENLNVIEVALNCGFHNHSYFTRAFVKKYGMTPVKYRKSCQNR